MSLEQDLQRQLHSKAALIKPNADLAELKSRIRLREGQSQRYERLAVASAVVVLAASLGGLAGALVNARHAPSPTSLRTGYPNAVAPDRDRGRSVPKSSGPAGADVSAPLQRMVISRVLPGELNVSAIVQALAAPVAISDQWSRSTECTTATVLRTSIGHDGSFGGATAVTGLPALSPDGLEILDSGILQIPGGGQVWWMAAAAGTAVARVAAENIGGSVAASTPSDGIAVVAGSVTGNAGGAGEMSAVAESGAGQSLHSLAFTLGGGPRVVGAALTQQVAGCSPLALPPEPASTSASQPGDEELDAASVVAAFEQAYSADQLLGFSANLAAVNGGASLSTPRPGAETDTGAGGQAEVGRTPAGSSDAAAYAAAAASASASAVDGPSLGSLASNTNQAAGGDAVDIRQVSFVSSSLAEVIYSVGKGVSFTGEAELGSDGIWRVSLSTFCGGILAGVVAADVPPSVFTACESEA